jgi:hypothetical protein
MFTKSIAAAAAIIVLSVASGVALAQTAGYPAAPTAGTAPAAATAPKQLDPAVEKFRAACKADITKLCAEAMAAAKATQPAGSEQPAKGMGRNVIGTCMTANEAKLSAECKTAWDERKLSWKAKAS